MDNIVKTVDGTSGITGRGQITQESDGTLKAPESIIQTVDAARSYYNSYRESHINRIRLYAAIEGLLAGNPPYNSKKLAALGLAHKANVNTLDAKATYEKVALTFWNLTNQTEYFVRFSLRPFQVKDDPQWSDWEEILSRNWTKVIKDQWTDFIPNMNVLTGQLVKFGISPIIWPDEQDFRWKNVDLSRFFVADGTPVAVEQWDAVCVETTFTVQYLYGIYTSFKGKKNEAECPWNLDQLEAYLLQKANLVNKGAGTTAFTNFLDAQTALQNGNLNTAAMFSDSVQLVSLLYKEYSGEISHFMLEPVAGTTTDFLFKVIEQYKNFQEALIVFTYSPGEMYIHGNRGVGHKIFPIGQASMQLDCNILDMAAQSSCMVVSSQATPGKDTQPIKVVPGVVVDIGTAQLQQNNLGSNIGGMVTVAQYMQNKLRTNSVISGDDPSQPDSDRGSKSAPEVQMQSIKEFGVGKQNVAHFYNTQDSVYYGMTAKMLHAKEGYACYKIVKKWIDLCTEEGVPAEIFETKDAERGKLPDHISVKAARVAGDGSHLGLIMGLNGVQGIAGGFGAKGQYNYRKDIITSRLGQDYVNRYLSDSAVPDEVGAGASLAYLENIAIKQGEMPQATKDNNHKTHIGTHMALITQIIQAVQSQKMDPIAADAQFSIALPHTGKHIEFLAEDSINQGFIEQITPSWRQIQKFAQLNKVKAQKMQQAEVRRRAEEEQQMNADMMEQNRKDIVAGREQNRKDGESVQKQERAKEQSQTKKEILKETTKNKGENDRLKIKLEADNKKEANRLNVMKKPQEILAGQSTEQIQASLESQVGKTPNPADFA